MEAKDRQVLEKIYRYVSAVLNYCQDCTSWFCGFGAKGTVSNTSMTRSRIQSRGVILTAKP